jgi:hypothetical protein
MRVELHYLQLDEHTMNVFWLKSNLNETSAVEEQLIAGTFVNWWTTDIRPLVTAGLQLYEVTVKELRPDGIAILYTEDLPVSGEKTEAPLPNNCALAVHWGTGLVGRSRHGRTYQGGLCIDSVQGNTCSIATSFQTAYDALRTALDNITINCEFVVTSFVSAKNWRQVPLTTPITGVAVESTMDSMRRRLPGRGQ